MGEQNKALILLLILVSLAVSVTEVKVAKAESSTLVVPDEYPTIADAIGNATDGDTVFVKKGIHEGPVNQTLVINKTISLIGEDPESTILNLHPGRCPWLYINIYMMGSCNSIKITASDVVLSGFTIKASGTGCQILIAGDRIKISNNNSTTGLVGRGNGLKIVNNTFATKHGYIDLYGSNLTVVSNNLLKGIQVIGSYNVIMNNIISGQLVLGLEPEISGDKTGFGENFYNLVYNNSIPSSSICLRASYSIVARNNATAITIRSGSYNTVCANNVLNGNGLYVTWGVNNTIYGNNVTNNHNAGTITGGTRSSMQNQVNGTWITNNTIYHNNFVNNQFWAGLEEVGTDYIYEVVTGFSGYPTNHYDDGAEGNYWSNYNGTDTNGDGIGDIAYKIDFSGNKDNYPLVQPFDISSIEVELPEWVYHVLDQLSTPPIPIVYIDSPKNQTYTTNNISLIFNVIGETSWMGYRLDGQTKITLTENTINLTRLSEGSHCLTVYANDKAGSRETSDTISFTIFKGAEPYRVLEADLDPDTPSKTWVSIAIMIITAVVVASILICLSKIRKQKH